jgi:hypothetical protein
VAGGWIDHEKRSQSALDHATAGPERGYLTHTLVFSS